MTLHPHITRAELTDYCRLCREYKINEVKVDGPTANAIRRLLGKNEDHYGVKFETR